DAHETYARPDHHALMLVGSKGAISTPQCAIISGLYRRAESNEGKNALHAHLNTGIPGQFQHSVERIQIKAASRRKASRTEGSDRRGADLPAVLIVRSVDELGNGIVRIFIKAAQGPGSLEANDALIIRQAAV